VQPTRKLKPTDDWKERPIYAFCAGHTPCKDGYFPGPLLVGSAGTLYGPVTLGGANDEGAIFELTYNSASDAWSYQLLYSFCALANCADGSQPTGGLLLDGSGNLVGTTRDGGSITSPNCSYDGCGVAFSVALNGTETVTHKFCALTSCPDGFSPVGGLVMDGSGNLFGSARYGGNSANGGTLFELTGTSLNVLYDFCAQTTCHDGGGPECVIMDNSGSLFGATAYGGAHSEGTVFEWTP